VQVKLSGSQQSGWGSWVVQGRETDDLLEHERLHYRIAAQLGRDLAKTLRALSPSSATLTSDITRLFTKCLLTLHDIGGYPDGSDGAYDTDTFHGNAAAQQAVWEQNVAGWESANQVTWSSNQVTWP
jgi:hypothetical protein